MFLTRTVPALLPSDIHSSRPWVPSSAVKNNRPPMAVRYLGPPYGGLVWVDVLDQDGARLGAIRLPQLLAVDAVVGGEEQRLPHGGKSTRSA